MTITVSPARNEYTANASQAIFNYTFKIFESTDLNVYITPSGQDANDSTDLTTAYTVTGLGDEDGGTVILSVGANANDLVTIVSNVPSARSIDYQNNGDFRPDTVNDDFDRVVSIAKKVEDVTNRTLVSAQSQQGSKPLSLPNPIAGFSLRWNGGLTGLENYDPSTVSNEEIANDKVVISYDTLLSAQSDTSIKLNQTISVKELIFNMGRGFFGDVVLASTVTIDNINYFACTGVPTLAIFRRNSILITEKAVTYFVNEALGTDDLLHGFGTGSNAFKTIQFAYDQIPPIIEILHQQTLQLDDGIFSTSYLPTGSYPRDAILFASSKFISARTQKNGNDLIGGIVIKGNSTTPSNVVIAPNDTYSYGIYNAQGQIGLQDFHIVTAAGSTNVNNLLTSHRMDSYVHSLNVTCDGRDKTITSRGILTESGGQLEFTTTLTQTDIKNCAILASTLTAGDTLTMSGQLTLDTADTGILAFNNSNVKFVASGLVGQEIKNCSLNSISVQSGAIVEFRGADASNHILVSNPVTVDLGGILDLIFTDTAEVVNAELGKIRYNNSNYQRQVSCKAGSIWLINSNSYISPAVTNTDTLPLVLQFGAKEYKEGINNIVGSGGSTETTNPLTLTFNGDSTTVAVTNGIDEYRVNGNGANRLNCQISSDGIKVGRKIYVYGDTWGVEFNDGAHMEVGGTNFTLGSGTGHYTGSTFVMSLSGKWIPVGLGRVVA